MVQMQMPSYRYMVLIEGFYGIIESEYTRKDNCLFPLPLILSMEQGQKGKAEKFTAQWK